MDDTPKTTHFWIQFVNFELDEDWLLQMDQRTFVIAQKYQWKRDVLFVGKSLAIEMVCPWNKLGSTPMVLLITYLKEMRLKLGDATQFVQDVVEEESEEEDDE